MTKVAQMVILIKQFDCNGILAQLGEHLPYKQGVIGSSPIVPTIASHLFEGDFFYSPI